MKNTRVSILKLLVSFSFSVSLAILAGVEKAPAFTRSEDELMEADVKEAKARARDFQAQQERTAKADAEREVASGEIKLERARFDEQSEEARVRYIENRNSKPDPEIEITKLESQFDEKKKREDDLMEANRVNYLKKRAAVQHTIESEAYIDQNLEYGVK